MLPALGSGPCFGRSRLTARLKTQAGCKYLRTIRSCTRQTAARRQPLSRVLVHAAQQQEDLQSDAEDKVVLLCNRAFILQLLRVSTELLGTLAPLQVPPGCARYTVQLSKPLGMVLEEKSNGSILVVWLPCFMLSTSPRIQCWGLHRSIDCKLLLWSQQQEHLHIVLHCVLCCFLT